MENLQGEPFYSGLSGLQLHIPQHLYPPPFENASRLTFYASLFNSIEINSSFYKIPQAATITKWAASVPENFRFTFKLWKEITHFKLNFYKAAIVIQDIPKSATPLLNYKSDFMYVRFHGPTGNYRDSYSDDFLNEYATCLNDWKEEGKTVYVYFNNTMGDAFKNLQTLNGLLQDKKLTIMSNHIDT